MDLSFTPEQEAFRKQVRAWVKANLPKRDPAAGSLESGDPRRIQMLKAWQRALYDAGYVAMGWPREFGGQGADVVQQTIVSEELIFARAPGLVGGMGIQMVGPTLIQYGTDEQRHRHLRKILTAEEIWCQGYSEPGSGSDLASLRTRAELIGDELVINGQKVWTSNAHFADWMFCLVRTDPDAPKHRGISYVLIDMKTPGITVRPLIQMTGEPGFNEVFFEAVRVPRENLVGALNQGWLVANATLQHERNMLGVPGPFFATAVLATLSLGYARAAALQQQWLPRIAAGQALATLAVFEEEPQPSPAGIRAKCTATRTGFRLSGTKLFVPDAHVADVIIGAFRTRGHDPAGVCLFAVPRDTPGVTIRRSLADVDRTRRPCEVEFANVELPKSARLADEASGWKVLSRVVDAACVVLAADSLGGAQRALEMAVEYSKTREQFGRPIGSFQAMKHMAAEMVSEIEPARSLVWYAAYAHDHEPERAALAAAMAKARLTDIYSRTTNRAVQMHGGIGFTWEHDMQLWFKRALWNRTAFGDAVFHRERVAALSI